MHIIDQSIVSHMHITYSHIQSCERIPTSNPTGKGSTHILTYNPVSGFIHTFDIFDQFKKTLILSHILQKQILYKI